MDTIKEDETTSTHSSLNAEGGGNCSEVATQELYTDEIANLGDFEDELAAVNFETVGDLDVELWKGEVQKTEKAIVVCEEVKLCDPLKPLKDISEGAIPKTFLGKRKKRKTKWLFPDSSDSDTDDETTSDQQKKYVQLSDIRGPFLPHNWIGWHRLPSMTEWHRYDDFIFCSDFHRLMTRMPKAYQLPQKMCYGAFRQGVDPTWISEGGDKGGHFVITFFRYEGLDLDSLWYTLAENILIRNLYNTKNHYALGLVMETDLGMIHFRIFTNDAAQTEAIEMMRLILRRDPPVPNSIPIVYVPDMDNQSLLLQVISEPVYV